MRSRRPLLLTAVHVAGLWAIAVVQPVLEVVGRAPEFFVAHRAGPTDILLLLAGLLLLAPLALVAVIALAGALGSRLRSVVTGMVVTVLVGLIAVQVMKQLGVTRWTLAALPATAAALLTALVYARFAGFRTFFTILAAGMLIVPVAFALQPGIRHLIVPNTSRSAPAEPGAAGFRPAPIVLMVFDELPLVSLLDVNRNIDPAFYPNLSALARDGVWFRNATTVSDYTRWAVPAILTGRRATPDAVPTAADHPDTLFSFLGRTHRLEVIEAATGMCPRTLCVDPDDTLRRRFAGMAGDLAIVAAYVFLTPDLHARLKLPDLTTNWAGFGVGADAGIDLSPRAWQQQVHQRLKADRRRFAQAFIDQINASDQQPTLYFLHALLPHQPWVLLPGGQRNSSLAPLPSPMRVLARTDDWEIAQNQQRHLLQVGYVDHVVGRVVARLKEAGLYERALVVVTADHGVALTKGVNARVFSVANAPEIMRVPLVMKFPAGIEATAVFSDVNAHGQRVSDRNVETVDIAPTAAHVLGVRLPWATDGSSLLDASIAPREEKRIAHRSGSAVQRFGPEGPPVDMVLRRRFEMFGAANTYRIPRPPKFGELVGHAAAEYRIVERPEVLEIRFAWQYDTFDPDADEVPFDVSGELRGRSEDAALPYLAVAVNGIIRAVTRTWTSRSGWLGTPPLDVWRRGRNSVDVFLIEESEGRPVLGRMRRPSSRPEDLNMISGAAAHYWGIRQRGFHRHERMGDDMIRWTRADAMVTIPRLGRKPVAIRLKIARSVHPAARLKVIANDCTLYEGVVPQDEWETTLHLGSCNVAADQLTIRLSTNVPSRTGESPSTTHGVAIRYLHLLNEPPADGTGTQ
jgi:arylsulfatase A-like enzyme